MSYLPYIVLGLLPSIIWLLFYLKEDCHPEPKKKILEIFFLGMVSALPAAIIQLGLSSIIGIILPPYFAAFILGIIGFAAVEEICKYSVVKFRIIKNREFDEPIDAMIYLIIAALGFAAAENLLLVFSNLENPVVNSLVLASGRLIGATFLHTLTSGIFGYFLAMSLYKKSKSLLLAGFSFATLLHGFYNFGINHLNEDLWLSSAYLIIILGLMALAVILLFRDLKKLPSVCK